MAKLVVGCGYLGRRVAAHWHAAGETVYVVTRSSEHARQFRELGWTAIVADVVRAATLVDLPVAETVLYAVGFDRTAGQSIHEVYVNGLAAVLDALPPTTGRLIYVSSTGVYGQTGGQWVDEESPCQPERDAGRACLAAEQWLAAHSLGSRSIILRLAGLYGPARIPHQRELLAGASLSVPADGYLNLVHVDDVAHVVVPAAERAPMPRTYVVSDGQPVLRRDYYAEAARLLGAPGPTFAPPAADSPATVRASSDKRASNRRLLAELQVQLAYPSYREGLAAILASQPADSA